MKKIGFLYEKIYDKNNIELAINNVIKSKRTKKKVKRIIDKLNNNKEFYINELHEKLKNETIEFSDYMLGVVYRPKERIIHKPNIYPDQVLHWAIIQVIRPYIEKSFYFYSCGCVPKKGDKFVKCRINSWLKEDYKNTKYCVQMDIKSFYGSVDNKILKRLLSDNFKCKRTLNLLYNLIDLKQGIPLGNYTSPWLANLYLTELDYLIKQKLNIKYYIRYMDDIVFFGSNKRELRKVMFAIKDYLKTERNLEIKSNYQLFMVDKRHLDFCGYVFERNRTRIRKRISLRIIRKTRKLTKGKYNHRNCSSFMSYNGYLVNSDSYVLQQKYIHGKINLRKIRRIIRNESKIREQRKTFRV